ncbi:MAG: hypothetical protein V4793_29615, partial [Paraburkholderia tropica]
MRQRTQRSHDSAIQFESRRSRASNAGCIARFGEAHRGAPRSAIRMETLVKTTRILIAALLG